MTPIGRDRCCHYIEFGIIWDNQKDETFYSLHPLAVKRVLYLVAKNANNILYFFKRFHCRILIHKLNISHAINAIFFFLELGLNPFLKNLGVLTLEIQTNILAYPSHQYKKWLQLLDSLSEFLLHLYFLSASVLFFLAKSELNYIMAIRP